MPDDLPTVLVACVRNAGRSQIAAALLVHHAANRVEVRSGGSAPAAQVHPQVSEVLAERGISAHGSPRAWTDDDVRAADVVITMGCGDTCPYLPGKRYEDWDVADPGGEDIPRVRDIVHDIDARVQQLLSSIGVSLASSSGQAH